MSRLMLPRLGLIRSRSWEKSVTVSPSFSPRPFSAPEIAARVSFIFTGSIAFNTEVSCWKRVLVSTVTSWTSSTCPSASGLEDGSGGATSSTDLAPKTVVDEMSTSTLAGMSFS
jgi:hypothetical protein